MRRSRRGSALSVVLFTSVIYTYWSYAKYALIAVILVLVLGIVPKLVRKLGFLVQNLRFRDIDTMDGITFEHYVAQLLGDCGYVNVALTEQYDYGVDIIAEKDGIRWGIQVKRYSGLVKAEAVRQVVTALPLYGCDQAMVITNSMFSRVAQHLAEGNNCVLIDRPELFRLAR